MHKVNLKLRRKGWQYAAPLFLGMTLTLCSCSDSDDWGKPSWLGESIYDELQSRGNFSIYLGMAEDLGQTDFLKKTGSVTVFAADDDAMRAYFKEHGIDEKHIPASTKKYLFNSSMLANAYVLDMLTNQPGSGGVTKGQIMRRTNTSWTVYDSIPYIQRTQLPEASVAGDFWKYLRDKEGNTFNLIDDGRHPMVHFIWRQMMTKGMTAEDFSYLFGGRQFNTDDVYINNVKVREGNVTCQNGYLNVMDGVPAPLPNMATYLHTNGNTNLFSKLIDRFSTVSSARSVAEGYKQLGQRYQENGLYSPLAGGDSVYVRRYFYKGVTGDGFDTNNGVTVDATLRLDPSMHDYAQGGDAGIDMGAIFAPTDEALVNYWNGDDGSFLRNRYPGEPFENVPNNVLAELLNNHIQYSFLNTLPSHFSTVLDDAKDAIGLDKNDIVQGATGICDNGAVYVMNKVYAPAAYRSVFAPVLVDDNLKIMRWAIDNCNFKPYLLSMVSYYNFVILSDEALSHYIDPVSYNSPNPKWFKFFYDEESKSVKAYSYSYDKKVGGIEGCKEVGRGTVSEAVLKNRLQDLLDFCTLPRDIYGGNLINGTTTRIQTKTNGTMEVSGSGDDTKFIDQVTGREVPSVESVAKDNGNYYIVNQMVQPTMKSLISVLKSNPNFCKFYELLENAPDRYAILKTDNNSMDGETLSSFKSYHYTVYIPDNAAMEKAFANGLLTWEAIDNLPNLYGEDVDVSALQKECRQRLANFLKYHIQDNSIFIGGDAKSSEEYETAATYTDGSAKGTSYKVNVESTGSDITVKGKYGAAWCNNGVAKVVKGTNSNQLVREYSFSQKAVTGSIQTSSWAVIHEIDTPLIYDAGCLCLKKDGKVNFTLE